MGDEKIRCKECDSTQTYLRIKAGERVCKVCGFVDKLKKGKKTKKSKGEYPEW